jgi:hypothetical protein
MDRKQFGGTLCDTIKPYNRVIVLRSEMARLAARPRGLASAAAAATVARRETNQSDEPVSEDRD